MGRQTGILYHIVTDGRTDEQTDRHRATAKTALMHSKNRETFRITDPTITCSPVYAEEIMKIGLVSQFISCLTISTHFCEEPASVGVCHYWHPAIWQLNIVVVVVAKQGVPLQC